MIDRLLPVGACLQAIGSNVAPYYAKSPVRACLQATSMAKQSVGALALSMGGLPAKWSSVALN